MGKKRNKPFQLKALLVGFAVNQHAGRRSAAKLSLSVTTPRTHTFSYIIAAALVRLNHFSKAASPVYLRCACLMTPLFLEESSQFFRFIHV